MGTLRFLFAFAVVGAHVGHLPWAIPLGGDTAVQSFYIISGFLIALVWDNKYADQPNGLYLFYTNRAARIYYLYWIVLVISILVALVTKYLTRDYPGFFSTPPRGLLAYSIFTNFFIFGSAEALWLGYDGSLYFTMDYKSSPYPVWRTMTLSPAWTLELELLFYLIAPFLIRRSLRLLVAIIAVSLAARFAWYAIGYDTDPWTYRFFPFEIAMFLLGVVTYRVSRLIAWKPNRATLYAMFAAVLAAVLFYPLGGSTRLVFVYLFAFAALLPYIFSLTRTWKVDRFLADMSFPLYLVHWPVWLFIRDVTPAPWPQYPGIVPAVASVAAAALLVVYVERPIERWRQARITSTANAPVPAGAVG
ncbi:acyltransferase [Bradyrhizobium lablabi]|uniref:acyltransferase family protein n=1 Tax=Bradyrhizobium lablabi TaxID=722472 RepID=UPI001BA56D02|nr:acyltransferase [Bradyrhizobium lablabi]MBR1124572.1 acyltransferase [Bradyrhizobium lablabi]